MGMELRSDTEIGLSILPVRSSNSAFAPLASIHYVQMPRVKFSEAHGIAKSSIIIEYKVAFVRHKNMLLHILEVHTYSQKWTRRILVKPYLVVFTSKEETFAALSGYGYSRLHSCDITTLRHH